MLVDRQSIQVSVGVIIDSEQQVLIAKRGENSSHSGLWEFPGGKVEFAEDSYLALCRELKEEIAINVIAAKPLLTVQHDYKDYRVSLLTWHVTHYQGQPFGMEGQQIKWVPIKALDEFSFPTANQPIIEYLSYAP